MKKKITLLMILIGILVTSCFKQEVAPVLIFDGEANMTIAEFQKLHQLGAGAPTLIDTAVIISGIITSTDQFGSCYQEIFFQDSTGGISIRVANTSYYTKYRIGQRIFVKAQGLSLGNYVSGTRFGFYQIGYMELERLSANVENRHVFRSDIPEKQPTPKIITSTNDIVTGIGGDYHTLVSLVDCKFQDADGTRKYFEPSGTLNTISQNISFNNGTGTIQARISAFCNFANDVLPEGTVNITGILTMYESPPYTPHQLIIRSIEDVEAPRVLKNYDMTVDPFSQGWNYIKVLGEKVWEYSAESKYLKIQPQSGNETECWLVSPKLNFAGEIDVALTFKYRIINGVIENTQLKYTIDGVNWKPLEFIPQSGNIDEVTLKFDDNISSNPNLQVAFQYKTTDKFPIWVIYNIVFKANVF